MTLSSMLISQNAHGHVKTLIKQHQFAESYHMHVVSHSCDIIQSTCPRFMVL